MKRARGVSNRSVHQKWYASCRGPRSFSQDELQRVSTSPEDAAWLMERDYSIDVRPLVSQLKTPTLVIHCDRDRAVPASVACSRPRSPGAVRLVAERQSPDAGGGDP
jgi:pimeloyl-ACP methyl ester carboxylesterase